MTRLAVSVGLGALLAAIVLQVVPGGPPSLLQASAVVPAISAGAIGLGVLLWLQQGWSDDGSASLRPSETPSPDRVGHRIDDALTASSSVETRFSPLSIRRDLRETLETLLVERSDLSRAEARDRRRAGTWTADPRAATFVGQEDVRPWRLRLRDWLYGDGRKRNIHATIVELDSLATDRYGPQRTGSAGDRQSSDGYWFHEMADSGAVSRTDPPGSTERPSFDDVSRIADWIDDPPDATGTRNGPGPDEASGSTDGHDVAGETEAASEVTR